MRHGLAVLAGALVVAGVDGGGGELAGLRRVRSAPGPPHAAGLAAVGFGGGVAQGLERVAAGGEVLRPVGHKLQLARLDLGAVLGLLQVAEVGHQLVGGAVEPLGLAVEHVDEAPEQALALVGELGAVRGDALRDDAEGFLHGVQRIVPVPDVAAVELVALGGSAVEGGVLADGRGNGLSGGLDGVDIEGHVDLP